MEHGFRREWSFGSLHERAKSLCESLGSGMTIRERRIDVGIVVGGEKIA